MVQRVIFIIIKHMNDILNFILFCSFKSFFVRRSRLWTAKRCPEINLEFENFLSVTTIVGVNLFVSLVSASNLIKQQPLIFSHWNFNKSLLISKVHRKFIALMFDFTILARIIFTCHQHQDWWQISIVFVLK